MIDAGTSRVAVIGLGQAGKVVASRLVSAGFEVLAYDKEESCEKTAYSLGASWTRDVLEAV